MTITYTPETGWSFTIGQQTHTGFPTRAAAQEARYDLERGRRPGQTAAQRITDAIDQILYLATEARTPAAQDAIEDDIVFDMSARRSQVRYERRLSSAGDGSGWDRYDYGAVSLDLEDRRGGCLCVADEAIDLDRDGIAQLLDLRALLNDARVVAKLAELYEK